MRTQDDRHHLLPRLRTASGEPVEKTARVPSVPPTLTLVDSSPTLQDRVARLERRLDELEARL